MELKERILDTKHIIIIIITIISLIISFFSVSFAYFFDTKSQSINFKSAATFGESTVYDPDVTLEGNLTYTTNKQNMLKNNQSLSFEKSNVDEYYYLLTIATQVEPHITEYELNEYTSISYEIYHKTDINLDTSNFTCDNNKYNNDDYCNKGTFKENSLEGVPFELIKDFKITDTNTHYFDVYIYLNTNTTSKKIKTKIFYLDKAIEKPKKYTQELIKGNDPDLTTGLIPVVYDDTKGNDTHWFVADEYSKWYDYESQWWANGVSVDSSTPEKRAKYVNEDGTYNTGVEIATSDMLALFVWIPRYSYTIGCHTSSSCNGYRLNDGTDSGAPTQTLPGAIDIKFVSKDTKDTYTGEQPKYTYSVDGNGMPTGDRNPSNYYTPPGFDFGGTPLSGIWVGKFETTGDITTPTILPNIISIKSKSVSVQFSTAQLLMGTNNIYGIIGDSHMTKNSEWAVVAYLSQSIYGKYGNKSYVGSNKEIYKNDSNDFYTGRVGTFCSAKSSSSDGGTYKYDDINLSDGSKVVTSGTGASTTGNIYGIYDMVGGNEEYVMGNYNDKTEDSGFDSSWFTTEGNSKYYDKFTITDIRTTKSSQTIGHAFVETKDWYIDASSSLSTSAPWVTRGGSCDSNQTSGVFEFDNMYGYYGSDSFRISLVNN